MHMIAVFFIVFLLFAFLKVPVGFSILLGGLAGYAAGGLSFDVLQAWISSHFWRSRRPSWPEI